MFCDQQLAPRGVISSLHLFFCSYAHVALRRVCLRDTKGRYAPECWGLLCQPGFQGGSQPLIALNVGKKRSQVSASHLKLRQFCCASSLLHVATKHRDTYGTLAQWNSNCMRGLHQF